MCTRVGEGEGERGGERERGREGERGGERGREGEREREGERRERGEKERGRDAEREPAQSYANSHNTSCCALICYRDLSSDCWMNKIS